MRSLDAAGPLGLSSHSDLSSFLFTADYTHGRNYFRPARAGLTVFTESAQRPFRVATLDRPALGSGKLCTRTEGMATRGKRKATNAELEPLLDGESGLRAAFPKRTLLNGALRGMGMPSDIKTQLIVFRSFAVVICLVCAGAIATASHNCLRTFVLRGPQTTRHPPRKEPSGSGLRWER